MYYIKTDVYYIKQTFHLLLLLFKEREKTF